MAEQALVADLRINLTNFDADLRKAMQAAQSASEGITKAFDKVDSSVKTLPAEFNKLNNSLKETEQASNRAAQATEKQTQVMGRFKGILGSLGLLVTAQEMIKFALSSVKAAEALTSIEQQFTMLTGSQKAAKEEMAFIRAETDRLALSTLEGAKGYARLANAAKGTKLEGEGVRQVFIGLNTVTRALRLSQEEYGRVLNQVTQIIAKGKIQTEELMTLAESGIPIYTMLAKSMGVSAETLSDMLQKGKVSSQALILLVGEIQKKYDELAEQAANTIPAKIERGWNKILQETTDVVQGILKSGELLNAFKFDSNMLDIFPSREEITAQVDYIIRQFTAISLIVEGAFKHTLDSIKDTFADVVSSLGEFLTPIGDFFKNLPGASWIAEQFQALVAGLTGANKTIVQSQKETAKFKGIFFEIFGTQGQTAVERWDNFVKDALDNFGKEMPPLIDSEKMAADAEKANAELQRLQEQAKKDLARLDDKARDDKFAKDIESESAALDEILKLHEDARRAQAQLDRKVASDMADIASNISTRLSEDAAKVEQMVEEFENTGIPTKGVINVEWEINEKAKQDLNKTIEDMKKNVRESMATTISDAIKGDLDNIQDAAELIKGIFADVFANIASEIIAKQVMDPLIDKFKGVIGQMKGIASGKGGMSGGGQTMGGSAGGGVMGTIGGVGSAAGAGVGVGMGVSNMAGGGKTGGIVGGMAGGAMTGAMIGSMIGPWGTIIGAAAGAIVGGVMGYLAAKDPVKTSLRMQTTAGEPLESENGARSISPFGVISLFDGSKASQEVSQAATLAISEIDAGIAKMLDSRQREIVQNYFRSAVPEGLQVESKDVGDAIAKGIQQRLYHALTALEGEGVAKNVVGELYTATSENIQGIQARAMEALDILSTIADFKAGDLSQTAQQIKAINQQFQDLKDRATVLGLPTEAIDAEQQKQLAKITTDFNRDIGDAILGITDPVKLEFEQLERMQEERRQNAIDAGADLTQLDKLERLEREELEKKHQENLTTITEAGQKEREAAIANIFQAIYAIEDPLKAALLGVQQQVAAFQAQADQGIIPQSLVDRYETSATDQIWEEERRRKEEEAQAVEDFNQDIYNSILGLKDANAAELAEMDRMHAERYQKAIEMGADLNAVAELNHSERLAKEKEHQDELTAAQEQGQRDREAALGNVFMMIWQIEDPFRAVMLSIDQQLAQLQAQVDQGLIPQSLVDRWYASATSQALEHERQRRADEAQLVEDFNQDIYNSILGMTDSSAAELAQLDQDNQERLDRAIAIGGDIAAVEEYNNMLREDLLQEHEDRKTAAIEQGQRDQENATNNILRAIYGITDPFQAALLDVQMQVAQFQAQVDQGLIPQSLVDRYNEVATAQVYQQEADRKAREAEQRRAQAQREAEQRRREAEQRKREAEQRRAQAQREAEQRKREAQQRAEQKKREAEQKKREAEQKKREAEQEAERRRQAKLQFNAALWGFTDPFKVSMQEINEQVREFRQMTKDGIVPKYAVDMFERLAIASLEVDRAVQALSGGSGSPIEQIGEAFEDFIRAGSPQSQAAEELATLQERFSGLVESAKILGLETAALEWSYEQQAKAIREKAIDAINKEMDAKKEQLKQIDDFLASMRLSDVLPERMRLGESRKQFGQALGSGDVQKAVSAAQEYLNIAQEQFGSTSQFFAARNEVERLLTNMQEQEDRKIEAEREKLILREERELEQVQISRTSVDFLRRISTDNSATSRGIIQLIGIAKTQSEEAIQTRQLLLRLAAKIKA